MKTWILLVGFGFLAMILVLHSLGLVKSSPGDEQIVAIGVGAVILATMGLASMKP